MSELPLNTGACEWVSGTLRRPLDAVEQELVTILCAGLSTGPWNISRNWRCLRSWGNGARMSVRDGLSTTDRDELSRLVFAAHDRSCRITINPAGSGMLEVQCWRRTRQADPCLGHPTLEHAVECWRAHTNALARLAQSGQDRAGSDTRQPE
jgi:hypothetical protein